MLGTTAEKIVITGDSAGGAHSSFMMAEFSSGSHSEGMLCTLSVVDLCACKCASRSFYLVGNFCRCFL